MSSSNQAKQRLREAIQQMDNSAPAAPEARVPDAENDGDGMELSVAEVKFYKRQARRRKWVRRLHKCNSYMHAIFWICLSGLVIYKTNFFKQLWENPEVNQFFLTVTLMAIGFQIALLAYLTLYGPLVLKRDLDMERDMPNMIPVMTAAGAVIFFGIVAAMWPVWGFLTPFFMIILFFGTSLSTMFLPSGTLGNFCFWIIAVVGGYVAHNLDHDPEW